MDCLVTKLKEAVDNNDLDFLGKGKLHVYTSTLTGANHFSFKIAYASEGSIAIVGDGYFTNSARTADYGKTKEVTWDAGEQVYYTGNTYLSNGNYSVLYDLDKIEEITYASVEGSGQSTKTYGVNLPDLKYAANLKRLYLPGTKSYGELLDLSLCTRLTVLFIPSTKITGSLKDLAEAQKNARGAGRINVRGNGIVTFDGITPMPNGFSSDYSYYVHYDGTGGYKITDKSDPADAEETVIVDGGYVTPEE